MVIEMKTRRNRAITLSLMPDTARDMTMNEMITLSIDALRRMGSAYDYWVIPFSGGKDSTAVVAFTAWAIETGQVKSPKKLLVLRSNTGLEIPELNDNAECFMSALRAKGYDARTVGPERSKGFYVQVLGKGLLPVHPGMKGRWCTRSMKVDPMKFVIEQIAQEAGEKFLMMSGVRLGESASRDEKLKASLAGADYAQIVFPACSVESGECGSGGIWMDKNLSSSYDAIPIIAHWRVCLVYDWLQGWVEFEEFIGERALDAAGHRIHDHGYVQYTRPVARMYGQHDDGTLEADSLRFGCMGCSAIKTDKMMISQVKRNAKLSPLLELQSIWSEMRAPKHRLRKPSLDGKPGRMGPLTIAARRHFLSRVLALHKSAGVALISDEDIREIESEWAANVYPRGWTGQEMRGDEMDTTLSQKTIFCD